MLSIVGLLASTYWFIIFLTSPPTIQFGTSEVIGTTIIIQGIPFQVFAVSLLSSSLGGAYHAIRVMFGKKSPDN